MISSYEYERKSLGKPEDSHKTHSRIAGSPVLFQAKDVTVARESVSVV
jgi:hypothetical protein